MVYSPLKTGASPQRYETPRSQPNAPQIAYAVLSGSTLGELLADVAPGGEHEPI